MLLFVLSLLCLVQGLFTRIDNIGSGTNCVVFFHALNENNRDPFNRLRAFDVGFDDVLFVLPEAPRRFKKSDLELGKRGAKKIHMWYEIPTTTGERSYKTLGGFNQTMTHVLALLDDLDEDCATISLAGFSQGAALALALLQTTRQKIEKLLMFSGYFITLPDYRNIDVPITWYHFKNDFIIPIQFARNCVQSLERIGSNLKFIEMENSELPHHFRESQVEMMRKWIIENRSERMSE